MGNLVQHLQKCDVDHIRAQNSLFFVGVLRLDILADATAEHMKAGHT